MRDWIEQSAALFVFALAICGVWLCVTVGFDFLEIGP